MRQSLHNAVRLTLGMEWRDSAVSPPWEAVWWQPEKPPQPLPAGTRIADVFQQTKQQLLILGEPGSGKTTTMLELARDLLEKAKGDKTQPIPVLVSLSSWKKPEVGIFEWLVAELKGKYGLRQELGKAWMQNRVLLPLLDGLDEVVPALQQKCAEAMNAWLTGELENKPCGVLVCCRREEFETIVRQKLSLQGAIYLQKLTPTQIEEYFAQFGLQGVWQTVGDDAALQELLVKPLFLSMFGLVQIQGKFDLAAWQVKGTSKEKIEYLFDTYWDAVMSRELIFDPHEKQLGWKSKTYKTKPLPERKAVRRMLVFLAKAMERDPSIGTELSIEKMQPSWLIKRSQKIIWGLIWGLTLGLIWGLTLDLIFGLIGGLIGGLFWGLIGGLIGGLFWGLVWENEAINTVEKISISMSREARIKITKKIREKLIVSLIGGLVLGLIVGLIGGLVLGLIGGLIWGLIEGLIEGCKADIQTKIHPNQGIKNSIKNMTIVLTIAAIAAFPLKLLLEPLLAMTSIDPDLSRRIISTSLMLLIWNGFNEGGGYAFIQHIALRIVLAWNRYVPFRFDLLLDYCTERLLMQRIGGRYRFMHKLLQDYFAKMELD